MTQLCFWTTGFSCYTYKTLYLRLRMYKHFLVTNHNCRMWSWQLLKGRILTSCFSMLMIRNQVHFYSLWNRSQSQDTKQALWSCLRFPETTTLKLPTHLTYDLSILYKKSMVKAFIVINQYKKLTAISYLLVQLSSQQSSAHYYFTEYYIY